MEEKHYKDIDGVRYVEISMIKQVAINDGMGVQFRTVFFYVPEQFETTFDEMLNEKAMIQSKKMLVELIATKVSEILKLN